MPKNDFVKNYFQISWVNFGVKYLNDCHIVQLAKNLLSSNFFFEPQVL